MPVTTRPSPARIGSNRDPVYDTTSASLHRNIFKNVTEGCRSPWEHDTRWPRPKPVEQPRFMGTGPEHFGHAKLIASSLDGSRTASHHAAIALYRNGFVHGVMRAFNQDLHLEIRPDDVWQAILSQFSLFVNGNAERLRHLFVQHKGKETLRVDFTPLPLEEVDFGAVAREFVAAIQANVVDPELTAWLLPAFSTTTDHDITVAAMGTMGTLQAYFDYEMECGCGLPSVTLLGERADWAMLADRIERLGRYGEECARWAELLRTVTTYFVRTFDAPDSDEVHDFWLRVAYEAGWEGSQPGLETLSGWLTAFAYFGEDGQVIKNWTDDEVRSLQAVERKRLVLDGVSFPLIRRGCIPQSVNILPLIIQDLQAQVQRFATVVAGSIGMGVSKDGATVQPTSAWWIVQEFEQPLKPLGSRTGDEITGSTTEETSDSHSLASSGERKEWPL